MDLEMTGLDPDRERIIEIATVVTDGDLEVVAEGPVLAIRQPESLLEAMDDWNRSHHGASGLLARVREHGVSEREAEAATLAFLEQHVEKKRAPLCGNTIWQDRRFLSLYMPTLEDYLHYRMVDVSSIKELVQRWRPDLMGGFSKKNEHTALADIRESIEELRYYRQHFLRHERPDDIGSDEEDG
jgi:oligoribonuclease